MENNNKQITTENANCLKFHSTDRQKHCTSFKTTEQLSKLSSSEGNGSREFCPVVMKGP